MKGSIELKGMKFHACHGCLESERLIPNLFIVDFNGVCEMTEAVMNDSLEGTVDYSKVYDIVAQEMAVPSKLLEHLVGRIVKRIAETLPEFESFSVSVAKRRPPVNGEAEWSKVRLNYPYL